MNLHRYSAAILSGLVVMFAITLARQLNTAAEAQVVVDRNRLRSLESRLSAASIASEKLRCRRETTGGWDGYLQDWREVQDLYPTPVEMVELARLRERFRERRRAMGATEDDLNRWEHPPEP